MLSNNFASACVLLGFPLRRGEIISFWNEGKEAWFARRWFVSMWGCWDALFTILCCAHCLVSSEYWSGGSFWTVIIVMDAEVRLLLLFLFVDELEIIFLCLKSFCLLDQSRANAERRSRTTELRGFKWFSSRSRAFWERPSLFYNFACGESSWVPDLLKVQVVLHMEFLFKIFSCLLYIIYWST